GHGGPGPRDPRDRPRRGAVRQPGRGRVSDARGRRRHRPDVGRAGAPRPGRSDGARTLRLRGQPAQGLRAQHGADRRTGRGRVRTVLETSWFGAVGFLVSVSVEWAGLNGPLPGSGRSGSRWWEPEDRHPRPPHPSGGRGASLRSPSPVRGDAVFQTWGRLEPGVGTPVHMGHRGRAGRMRSWSAWSDAAGRANGAEAVAPGARSAGPTAGAPGVPPSTAVGAKVMPG